MIVKENVDDVTRNLTWGTYMVLSGTGISVLAN
jgi:hypothetical protein